MTKRLTDIILALLLIVPITAVCLVLGAVNTFLYKTPPLYLQQRIGLDGRRFTCLKLKSMRG